MDEQKPSEVSMKRAPACGRCHLLVARYAPQVATATGTHHRECFEAWYVRRYGARPALLAGGHGDRHRFQIPRTCEVPEKAA